MLDKIKGSIVPYVLISEDYYTTKFEKNRVTINRHRKGYVNNTIYICATHAEDGFYVEIHSYDDEKILRSKLDLLSGIIYGPSARVILDSHLIKFKSLDHFLNKIDSFF